MIPRSFSSSGPGHPDFGVAVGVGVGGFAFEELALPPLTPLLEDEDGGGEGLHGISLLVAAHVPGLRKVLLTPDIVH
jgi:hypothetical protein